MLAGFSMRSSYTSVLVAANGKNSGFYAVNCHFFLPNWGGAGRRGGREGGKKGREGGGKKGREGGGKKGREGGGEEGEGGRGGGFCQMCLENQPSTSAIHGRPLHLACSTGN